MIADQKSFRQLATLAAVAVTMIGVIIKHVSAQEIQKIAFVAGVSQYQKDGLADLSYAHKDANDLADELTKQGFKVVKLIGADVTKTTVEKRLEQFFASAGKLGKTDVVLVSFSGHGVQKMVTIQDGNVSRKVETPFFCVYDSLASDPDTLISLNWVLKQLETRSGSSNNLLIVDACRNNPDKGAKTLDGSTVKELPTKISILFSSSPGQKSYEAQGVQQGIFTHVLLNGLRGEAKNSRDEVDWLRLAAHVVSEVPLVAPQLLNDPSIVQRPNLVGNAVGSPVIASLKSSRSQLPQSLTNSIGMKFNLIPAGKFLMGSPESELDYSGKHSKDEQQHPVEITKSFYLGVHEVTQSQYETIMGSNPSYFSATGGGKNTVSALNTANFPVEQVSWDDAKLFIDRLNTKEQSQRRKYRLPTEAEWEYACRAGTTSPFSFGRLLNGAEANCDGNYPYGTDAKGKYLQRPADVGSYDANGFGIFDMHGNVYEWCEDLYDAEFYGRSPAKSPVNLQSGSSRVLRGGSWRDLAASCRSAYRSYDDLTYRYGGIGFRVLVELE